MFKKVKLSSNLFKTFEIKEFNFKRIEKLNDFNEIKSKTGKCVFYWMFRDQRTADNWSLIYSYIIASKNNLPLLVYFPLIYPYEGYTLRHYKFMIDALEDLYSGLKGINAELVVDYCVNNDFDDYLKRIMDICNPSIIVVDHLPMIQYNKWVHCLIEDYANPNCIPVTKVDSHNVVPCWIASNKVEYAARTIRPKLISHLKEFLTEYPTITTPLNSCSFTQQLKDSNYIITWDIFNYNKLLSVFKNSVQSKSSLICSEKTDWAIGGQKNAQIILTSFINNGLQSYNQLRNDPTASTFLIDHKKQFYLKTVVSHLSPWLHFGHISSQSIINRVSELKEQFQDSVCSFVEELLIRKELSDNFCHFSIKKLSFDKLQKISYGAEKYFELNHFVFKESVASWAIETLTCHIGDKRSYIYSLSDLMNCKTHDSLWNASQKQMMRFGKMHGFLRMYWAKKILEWTHNAQTAFNYCLYLNDAFNLDGSDPNGIVGCLWSIYGLHDQAWKERPIFGKIRYMNYQGCQRKFSVDKFIAQYDKEQ